MTELLVLIRAVHVGASLVLMGGWVFLVFIAQPVLSSSGEARARARFDPWWARLMKWSLAASLASGGVWLGIEAAVMSGLPWSQALTRDIIGAVLTRTQFGRVWELRAALLLLLATYLARRYQAAARRRWLLDVGAGLPAGGLLASLSWSGHAAASAGLHVASDAVHLLAAGAWLGALIPLGFILAQAQRSPTSIQIGLAGAMTHRFSLLGLISVGSLIATGLLNTYFLVGAPAHLIATFYGRLLLLKLALFGLMVGVAADNRLRLMPRLLALAEPERPCSPPTTLHRLWRNVAVEIGLGTAILLMVGALGITPPAIHMRH